MRIIYSEFQNIYATYTFAYGVYCCMEQISELPEVFAKGFLPFTGIYTLTDEIFYLARSVRVDLDRFEDTSENRRVDRKVSPLNIQVSLIKKQGFPLDDPQFRQFCEKYAQERFKSGEMNQERLDYVLSRDTLTHIFVFKKEAEIIGYVFAAMEGNSLGYWYSFYNTDLLAEYSLGKWMMWRTIRWAKDNGLRYAYLGTVYKRGGLYKVRDHKGVEFFDGSGWNTDLEELYRRCDMDEESTARDHDLLKSTSK